MSRSRQTALITGGARRIGKAIALHLASLGWRIAIHYQHSVKEAKALAAFLNKGKPGSCKIFPCDLSDEQAVQSLIPNVLDEFGKLELLINNASIFEKSTLRDCDFKSLARHWAINFRAPYILTSIFARECRKGQIINILDTHVVSHQTQHTAYLLSKRSLDDLTQLAAVELAPYIRVNSIAPGLILPPEGAGEVYLDRLAKKIPMRKKGHPHDIAQAVEFLIKNTYITGQRIFVDGGEHLKEGE